MDVGAPSEQPDGGDRLKAAFSDALKRAAVKFGIGRYLYRLPQQWVRLRPGEEAVPAHAVAAGLRAADEVDSRREAGASAKLAAEISRRRRRRQSPACPRMGRN